MTTRASVDCSLTTTLSVSGNCRSKLTDPTQGSLLEARLDGAAVKVEQRGPVGHLQEVLDVGLGHVLGGLADDVLDGKGRRAPQHEVRHDEHHCQRRHAAHDADDGLGALPPLVALAPLLAALGRTPACRGGIVEKRGPARGGLGLGRSPRPRRGSCRWAPRRPCRWPRRLAGTGLRPALGRQGPAAGSSPPAGVSCQGPSYAPKPSSLTSHARSMSKRSRTASWARPIRLTTSAALAWPVLTMKLACSSEVPGRRQPWPP